MLRQELEPDFEYNRPSFYSSLAEEPSGQGDMIAVDSSDSRINKYEMQFQQTPSVLAPDLYDESMKMNSGEQWDKMS